ncbi:MAG: amidohydrolase family protein [Eubacterium sp.]|nr:amidohydrolase family protein [Eubacterium sp.]
MIIDIHTHTFPDKIAKKALEKLAAASKVTPATLGTQEDLRRSMREAGIDYSVVLPVATSPKQVESINRLAVETNLTSKETGIIYFGALHPDCENYRQVLLDLAQEGVSGIKLHPDYQLVFFNDIRMKRIVEAATELGLYVMVHAGEDVGLPEPIHCTPPMVEEVLRETESDRLILAHMGGWRLWDQVEEHLVGRKLYLDTAFSTDCMPEVEGMLDREAFCRMVRNHGADRILFGTDSPWSQQAAAKDWILSTDLTREEKDVILGENAAKILNIYD